MDMPYKKELGEEWDTAFITFDELVHILNSINIRNLSPFHVVVLWINPSQLNVVTEALLATGHDNVQQMFWGKIDNRPPVPPHRFGSITEQCVVGYSKGTPNYSSYLNMPLDIMSRGNLMMSKGLHTLTKNVSGEVINRFEKPPWLAQHLISILTKPGAEVLVLGSGAGGDVKGILNAGRDCLAIESDTKQYDAMVANLLTYQPVCQLEEMIPTSEVLNARKAKREAEVKVCTELCDGCLPETKTDDTRRCPGCKEWLCPYHWPHTKEADPYCPKCVQKAVAKKADDEYEKAPDESAPNPLNAGELAQAPSE